MGPFPFFMFGGGRRIPESMTPAYCALYALFAYVMGGMLWYWFFDWHAEFGEWIWFEPILGTPMIGLGILMTVIFFRILQGQKGERPAPPKE
jgi:hypothetical protein